MLLYGEDVLKAMAELEEKQEDYARARILVLDTDNDSYKTINRIRIDSEGDIIIDVSE